MLDFEEVFNDSYARILMIGKNREAFFDRFYKTFVSSSPVVAEKFKNTDMKVQKKMLRRSMYNMLDFLITKKSSDYMEGIARKHSKHEHDVTPELYDLWLDCLISVVKEFDPKFNDDVELSWRVVLSLGITYMKFKYDR